MWPQPGTAGGRECPRPSRPQGARAVAVGRTTATAQALASQGTGGGLVICAKSVRDTAEDGVDAELLAADALGLRFPRPDLVAAAASAFERAQPWAHGPDRLREEPESGRFRIAVGPGVVRLGWTSPVRAEKASERAINRHRLDVTSEVVRIKADRDIADPPGPVITEWSRKSRAAMPHLRRARLHATGGVRPCAGNGDPDLPWRLGMRRP